MTGKILVFAMACVSGMVHALPGETILRHFPANAMGELTAPADHGEAASIELDPTTSVDQGGAFKITYQGNGAGDVLLFRVPASHLPDAELWYRARVRTETPGLNAYLEMYCTFEDGNTYFSRALHEPIGKLSAANGGGGGWARSQTPFYLEKNRKLVRVDLGLRFEQPGVVWIDQIALSWRARPGKGLGAWLGILGGAVGSLAGLWGASAGFLLPRGRGRRWVLGSGLLFLGAGITLLASGLLCWILQAAYAVWYPLTLSGGIVTVLFAFLLPGVLRRYRAVELERIAQQDGAEDL